MRFIALTLTIFLSHTIFAQNILVEAVNNNVDPSNSTNFFGIETKIKITNNSSSGMSINVSKEVLSATPGTDNNFCWVICYPSNDDNPQISPDVMFFEPSAVNDTSFKVSFFPLEASPASASIKYCAFNATNPSDSTCTIVHFSDGVSALDEDSFEVTRLFPNPANTFTKINYNLSSNINAEIVVSDMLGSVVFTQDLLNESGSLQINLTDFNAGLYFVNFMVNNQLEEVQRLVVSK